MQVRILPPLPISLPGSSGNPSLAASEDHRAYSYLLGAYLGDGYLCRMPRTWRLEVYLHRDDTPTIDRVRTAISALLPGRRVGLRAHGAAVVVTSYFKGWPALFPQHGAGLKHTRPIVLQPWQRDIVERHPEDFIRGCIDSDGCRHRRIVKGRNYPAYSFKNHSADILALFAEVCSLAGIRWRKADARTSVGSTRSWGGRRSLGRSWWRARSGGVSTPSGRTSGSGHRSGRSQWRAPPSIEVEGLVSGGVYQRRDLALIVGVPDPSLALDEWRGPG